MSLDQIYNFRSLSPDLLTSGQPTASQLAEIARTGVQTVINLALPTSDNALPDEESLVRSLGMEYLHIPVEWEHPTQTDLERFLEIMQTQAGHKLLVHCAANYRASCFVALWHVLRQGWALESALEEIHRIWDENQYPVWKQFMADALAQEGK
jgi:uncharacterized protein (TIGR01244 family)